MKKVSIFIFLALLTSYFLYTNTTKELFVSTTGSDLNSGRNPFQPLKTIQRAVDIAEPGTTIKVHPGIYRESVVINQKKPLDKPLHIESLNKKGKRAQILGSESSKSLSWNKCSIGTCKGLGDQYLKSVYYADIGWSESPQIIVQKTKSGEHMLTIAQSPNYNVKNTSRYLENLWKGGNTTPSMSVLEDKEHLTTGFSLSGATAILVDGGNRCGMFIYSSSIDKHDADSGVLYFKKPVGFSFLGSQEYGIGQKTRYLIQGKIHLLDTEGEWVFDKSLRRLYVWPKNNVNPAKGDIEIAKRPYGIKILNANNTSIVGFAIKNVNASQDPFEEGALALIPQINDSVSNIEIRDIVVANSINGIITRKRNDSKHLGNIHVENALVENITGKPVFAYNFKGFTVKASEIANSSHFSNYNAITINKVSNVTIESNHIHNVGANGILFLSHEKENNAVRKIRVTGNKIDHVCESLGTCSGIKFFDGRYEDTIVKSNTITNNLAWAPCTPYSGIGLMISNASGIKVTSNKFQNNTQVGIFLYTRQLPSTNNQITDNIINNSRIGILLGSHEKAFDADPQAISTRHDNVVIYKNVLKNNGTALVLDPAKPENVVINKNTYSNNNWSMNFRGSQLKNTSDITKNFPFWENGFKR